MKWNFLQQPLAHYVHQEKSVACTARSPELSSPWHLVSVSQQEFCFLFYLFRLSFAWRCAALIPPNSRWISQCFHGDAWAVFNRRLFCLLINYLHVNGFRQVSILTLSWKRVFVIRHQEERLKYQEKHEQFKKSQLISMHLDFFFLHNLKRCNKKYPKTTTIKTNFMLWIYING